MRSSHNKWSLEEFAFIVVKTLKEKKMPPIPSSAGLEYGLQTTAVTRQKRCLTTWMVKDVKINLT